MNKKIIFPMLSVLVLAGCTKPAAPAMESEELAHYISGMTLKGLDDVRGNIYLPEEVEGLSITWSCDQPGIINCEADGDIAPGSVTRPSQDTTVHLTASIKKDGKVGKFTQEATVKGLARELTDDDYVGYLLVTFTGEGSANGEQVYMSLAPEGAGFNFQSLNGNQPILSSIASEKGVRDPFVYRSPEGDRFFIVATDLKVNNRPEGGWSQTSKGYTYPTVNGKHTLILWETEDLTNWGEPKYIDVAPKNAGMAWAPEMTWHEETGQYVIFWSSCIIDDLSLPDNQKTKVKGDAVYYTTTRDFEHFGETKLFIDNQKDGVPENSNHPDGRNIIDATCTKIGDHYYAITKDGDNPDADGGIRIFKSDDILDYTAWEKVLDLDELGLDPTGSGARLNNGTEEFTNRTLEGPALFQFNKCDWEDPNKPEWCIMGDRYNAGNGYLPFSTTDIEDTTGDAWSIYPSSKFSWGNGGKRHGSVLKLTKEEAAAIGAKWLAA